MELEDKIKKRFDELIKTGKTLKVGNQHDQVLNEQHRQECIAWSASAQNLVHLVIKNPDNPYRASVDKSCASDRGYCAQETVGEVSLMLKSIVSDIELGLLASIEDQTRASIFDDFLDHAKDYINNKYKNEAGVIAGVAVCELVGTWSLSRVTRP